MSMKKRMSDQARKGKPQEPKGLLFRKVEGAVILDCPKSPGKYDAKYRSLRSELERIDPRLLNDPEVSAIEIDRQAVGKTYKQHVDLLRGIVEKHTN